MSGNEGGILPDLELPPTPLPLPLFPTRFTAFIMKKAIVLKLVVRSKEDFSLKINTQQGWTEFLKSVYWNLIGQIKMKKKNIAKYMLQNI